LLKDAAAFVLFPFVYFRKYACVMKMSRTAYHAAFIRYDVDLSILPNVLRARYTRIDEYPYVGEMQLTAEDKAFFREAVLMKYRKHLYFCIKLLMRMEMYSFIIRNNDYSAVISHCEDSFTSSFLSAYCEHSGVKHINVMHGEKLFEITDAFVSFNEFYIWDEWYERIFMSLRAAKGQFICAAPESLLFGSSAGEKLIDFTYYLQQESNEELSKIAESLRLLAAAGHSVALRPHPRFSDLHKIHTFFLGINIEDSTVPLKMSVQRTNNAVSLSSTVLYQALLNEVSIVIDDITNPGKYQRLLELDYICINKPHRLLSEVFATDQASRR
jgi:hypothetical protein